MAASMIYLQTASTGTDASAYTFASQNLGTASSDRYIVVAIGSRKSGSATTVSSVTVGGVSATIVASQFTTVTNTGAAAIAIASVPTGTTGDVVVTFGATMVRCTVSLYSLTGVDPTTYSSAVSGAIDPTGTINVLSGGVAIGVASTSINSLCTWTGLTEDYDNNETGESTYRFTTASATTATTTSLGITADFASSSESAGVFASWGPASTSSIALVNHTLATSGVNGVTTSAISTTGSNFIVVGVSTYTGGAEATVTDNKSNTWTKLTSYSATSNSRVALYYATNPTVGSGHTFTATATGSYPGIAVQAFSNVSTSSPFDVQNGAGNAATGTTRTTGSVTPTVGNELIIAAVANDATVTMSIDNGMTITDQQSWVSSVNMGIALAYKTQGTAAAINPTWTSSASTNLAAAIATFKESAGTTGQIKVYNGSSWVAKPIRVWNGTAWVTKPIKRYNGTSWVVTPY